MSNKESIRLRRRNLSTGNISLYLDIYIGGRREYEYLKLYLIPEKSKADRDKNREILKLAEAIRAKRIIEVQNRTFGFKADRKDDVLLLGYLDSLLSRKKADGRSIGQWRCLRRHIVIFAGKNDIPLSKIDGEWIRKFRDYLDKDANDTKVSLKPLSATTKHVYFCKFRSIFFHAFKDGIISSNPVDNIEGIRTDESHREYLTSEELRRLSRTRCSNDKIRRSFLFSCLTGMRISDIMKLTWSEVSEQDGFTRLTFKQKKTKSTEYLDITPQAAELMGERGEANALVFNLTYHNSYTNHIIIKWTRDAGIV